MDEKILNMLLSEDMEMWELGTQMADELYPQWEKMMHFHIVNSNGDYEKCLLKVSEQLKQNK